MFKLRKKAEMRELVLSITKRPHDEARRSIKFLAGWIAFDALWAGLAFSSWKTCAGSALTWIKLQREYAEQVSFRHIDEITK